MYKHKGSKENLLQLRQPAEHWGHMLSTGDTSRALGTLAEHWGHLLSTEDTC